MSQAEKGSTLGKRKEKERSKEVGKLIRGAGKETIKEKKLDRT